MEDPIIDLQSDHYFMGEALRQAARAYEAEEVPVGAVVVREGRIIARASNQVELLKDATAHAEMLALTAAQEALGDVVFVDLPTVGKTYKMGEVAGVVESVKAAADINMPCSGEVVEVNEALRADPSLANRDPMGEGWFFKVHLTDMGEFDRLMDPPGYDALLKTL